MKAQFVNAIHRTGKSFKVDKVNGKPFDFTQVTVAVPFEAANEANFQSQGHGFEIDNYDLDPMALAQFADVKLGQEIDLIIEPQPKNARRTWVIGRK